MSQFGPELPADTLRSMAREAVGVVQRDAVLSSGAARSAARGAACCSSAARAARGSSAASRTARITRAARIARTARIACTTRVACTAQTRAAAAAGLRGRTAAGRPSARCAARAGPPLTRNRPTRACTGYCGIPVTGTRASEARQERSDSEQIQSRLHAATSAATLAVPCCISSLPPCFCKFLRRPRAGCYLLA